MISWKSRPKSSKPSNIICEWLAAVFVLRDIAVANRRIRTDIYKRVSTAETQQTDDELEEYEDDGSRPITADVGAGEIDEILETIDLAEK